MDAINCLINQRKDNEKKIKGHHYQSHTIFRMRKGVTMMDIPRVDPLVLVGFLETIENLGGKSSMGGP